MAKVNKNKDAGYVPFSKEDINLSDGVNTEAEELFLQMLDTPKLAAKKIAKGKSHQVDDDDFYPTSKEETEQMESLLNEVEAKIEDRSDKEFMDNVSFMRGVIEWSKKRHWTFSWIIAICVVCVTFYFKYQADDFGEQADKIEAWTQAEAETKQKEDIDRYQKWAAEYKAIADTATQYKESYKRTAEGYTERVEELSVPWEKYREMEAKYPRSESRGWMFWQYFWYVMIVLYVFAERPFGYMITNRRLEMKLMGGLKKFGFAVAGGLVGIAGALQFTEVITSWSDGSKTRGDDGSGPLIIALKILFLIAAAIVVAVVSCFIMLYGVIMGILRNYGLIPLIKEKIKSAAQKREAEASQK